MSYHYETLGPDRFQELAQALIVTSHPDTQCLPVLQPDGGRDAFQFHFETDEGSFIVFQVKYSKEPKSKDERTVIEDAIRTEESKIRRLIERGATKYYLITNVEGTAHLDSGSIDRTNDILTDTFKIPAQVWWRTDLNARIDGNPGVKWSFPEILKATDVLPLLIERYDEGNREKTIRAITGYIATQYQLDREVKFKQVELKKRLTDLFVDMPLALKRHDDVIGQRRRNDLRYNDQVLLFRYMAEFEIEEEYELQIDHRVHRGNLAAESLLQMPHKMPIVRLVIEGAPGQGKSTVTQYICQVSRVRLLNKFELASIPLRHRNSPVRVPFRVDLRDFAAWVAGRHPFAKAGEEAVPAEGQRSLESFLTMQVAWQSGGLDIEQNDLLRFFEQSHCLIVLDGFDEVADIEIRGKVVEEICKASERLEALAASIQIVVTSRPAAFANSPGFPEDDWIHLELRDLRRRDIEGYKEKWALAHSLTKDEKRVLSETLNEKLEQPHLRDLSRNPMQLAILLQLIHIQGPALPDKRTTLYEKYMELYFNREAEKASVVRAHRDLLMSIHGFIGWVLQTQAEEGRGSGSVEEAELHRLVREYLKSEEYEPGLADELLKGMVERVVALVSRVEGTYEFEVQPIREYFTAKYLYETAAYSPAGRERTGTRPERFEALAKSPYWTNVTRFFCGFYDKGELASLVDSLLHLSEQNGYRLINQPRRLALMLLSDWVFSQSPRNVRKVIEYIVEEPGFLRLTSSGDYQQNVGILALPERSGQKELVEACLAKLETESDPIRRSQLRRLLAQNSSPESLKPDWLKEAGSGKFGKEPLQEAMELNIIRILTSQDIETLCGSDIGETVKWLGAAGHHEEVTRSDELIEKAISALFDARFYFAGRHHGEEDRGHWIGILTELIRPQSLGEIFLAPAQIPAIHVMARRRGLYNYGGLKDISPAISNTPRTKRVLEYTVQLIDLLQDNCGKWQSSLANWSTLVDKGIQQSDQRRLLTMIALLSSTIRSKTEKGEWTSEGRRLSTGVVARLRHARLKSGQPDWWERQIEETSGTEEAWLCLTACLLWSTTKTLSSIRNLIAAELNKLSDRDWLQVTSIHANILRFVRPSAASLDLKCFEGLSGVEFVRFGYLALGRLEQSDTRAVGRRLFKGYMGDDRRILGKAAGLEFPREKGAEADWGHALSLSRLAKKHDVRFLLPLNQTDIVAVPDEVAIDVLEQPEVHAVQLVAACERSYGMSVARSARKVSSTAAVEKWFESNA